MKIEKFPYCCGITVISDFGYSNTAYDSTEEGGKNRKTPEKEITAYLKEKIKAWKIIGMLLVALDTRQVKVVEPLLLKEGFKKISKQYNGTSGIYVHLYLYEFGNKPE